MPSNLPRTAAHAFPLPERHSAPPRLAGITGPDRRMVAAGLPRLSRREKEIVPLLAARWTDREIAAALGISYRTVTTHVGHILSKLGVDSRRAVAAFEPTVPPIRFPGGHPVS